MAVRLLCLVGLAAGAAGGWWTDDDDTCFSRSCEFCFSKEKNAVIRTKECSGGCCVDGSCPADDASCKHHVNGSAVGLVVALSVCCCILLFFMLYYRRKRLAQAREQGPRGKVHPDVYTAPLIHSNFAPPPGAMYYANQGSYQPACYPPEPEVEPTPNPRRSRSRGRGEDHTRDAEMQRVEQREKQANEERDHTLRRMRTTEAQNRAMGQQIEEMKAAHAQHASMERRLEKLRDEASETEHMAALRQKELESENRNIRTEYEASAAHKEALQNENQNLQNQVRALQEEQEHMRAEAAKQASKPKAKRSRTGGRGEGGTAKGRWMFVKEKNPSDPNSDEENV